MVQPSDTIAAPRPKAAPEQRAPEDGRSAFLAFLTDEESEAALRAGLADRLERMEIRRGGVRAATRLLERQPTPHVLLVDVSGEAEPAAALEALSAVCAPDAVVLVVGERQDLDFYREVVRDLGTSEYAGKPLTRDSVARLFGPHLAGTAAQDSPRSGRIVALASMRGGSGATTIAVNLAALLAETSGGHVALLDLHLRGGAAASMLGAKPGPGLRLALEDPERADALFLDRTAIPIGPRLRLLAAEEALEAELRPTPEGALRVLELLRARSNTVVVDLRWPPGPVERAVLAAARHRVLVMRPDLVGVRETLAARRLLSGLPGTGQVLTLANRVGGPGLLPEALLTEGLGGPPDLRVPDLPRRVPRAADMGKPALHDCPPLARALAPLVQEISARRTAGTARRTGLLGRLRAALGR
jgi:pilus assembly protein CpaE